MKKMQINYDDYMFLKVCQLIFLEKDSKEILVQVPNIYTKEFLIDFAEIVKQYCSYCFIGGDIKDNVLRYLREFRFMEIPNETKDDYHFRIDTINSVIISINKQLYDGALKFYCDEMYKKTNDRSYLYADYEIINNQKEVLNGLVKFDCAFLYTHSKYISEDVFIKEYVPMLIGNDCYFQSLNSVLKDAPCLFSNPIFKKRVLTILKEDYKITTDKILKKDIKILQKRINRGTYK